MNKEEILKAITRLSSDPLLGFVGRTEVDPEKLAAYLERQSFIITELCKFNEAQSKIIEQLSRAL